MEVTVVRSGLSVVEALVDGNVAAWIDTAEAPDELVVDETFAEQAQVLGWMIGTYLEREHEVLARAAAERTEEVTQQLEEERLAWERALEASDHQDTGEP